jgi:hypothetical protein
MQVEISETLSHGMRPVQVLQRVSHTVGPLASLSLGPKLLCELSPRSSVTLCPRVTEPATP